MPASSASSRAANDGVRISAIVPVFNGERYLKRCLQSIFEQTYAPCEVIVIDDGSSDGSRSIVEGYGDRVVYRYQANSGTPANPRNKAIELASGDYLAFVDQDDYWAPDKLQKQAALLSEQPHLRFIHTDAFEVESDGLGDAVRPRTIHARCQPVVGTASIGRFLSSYTVLSSILIEKRFARELGVFREECSPCDDTDLFLRLGARHEEVGYVPEPLTFYRRHRAQTSADRAAIRAKKIEVIERYVDQAGDERRRVEAALASERYLLGVDLFERGQYAQARSRFEQALRHRKAHLESWIYYAGLSLDLTRLLRASRWLSQKARKLRRARGS